MQSLEEYFLSSPNKDVLTRVQGKLLDTTSRIPSPKKRKLLQKVEEEIAKAEETHARHLNKKHMQEERQFEQAMKDQVFSGMQGLFFECVRSNNLSLVKRMLNASVGVDLNRSDTEGLTALAITVDEEYGDMILLLLKSGTDVNRADGMGLTPLTHAVLRKNFFQARVLMEHGANPNQCDGGGVTPLLQAVAGESFAMTRQLREAGADLNVFCKNAPTPLTGAVFLGDREMARFLADLGANITQPDGSGGTALATAASKVIQRWSSF